MNRLVTSGGTRTMWTLTTTTLGMCGGIGTGVAVSTGLGMLTLQPAVPPKPAVAVHLICETVAKRKT